MILTTSRRPFASGPCCYFFLISPNMLLSYHNLFRKSLQQISKNQKSAKIKIIVFRNLFFYTRAYFIITNCELIRICLEGFYFYVGKNLVEKSFWKKQKRTRKIVSKQNKSTAVNNYYKICRKAIGERIAMSITWPIRGPIGSFAYKAYYFIINWNCRRLLN